MPDASDSRIIGGAIESLLLYGVESSLILPPDIAFVRNELLDATRLPAPEPDAPGGMSAPDALGILSDYAASTGLCADSPASRERFITKLMGLMTPSPEAFRRRFESIEREDGILEACGWFGRICEANGYINAQAVSRNVRYYAPSPYGALEITINVAKPEKDPRDIAALASAPERLDYPACLLCVENEGYAGRAGYTARQTLRTLPLTLDGDPWRFQYSPYQYFAEHCIALDEIHRPMRIDASTFRKLFDFLDRFPHYVIGSNADLPIVGGSVLNHNHFQGGRHTFPMEKAEVSARFTHPMAPRVDARTLNWPMSAVRLASSDRGALAMLAEHIRIAWSNYSDPALDILARTGSTPHNTVTPIARGGGAGYSLDLVLRNNRATDEHPLGLFHPHAALHHVKKENIGLIEVMGLFILPGRLLKELDGLRAALTDGIGFRAHEPGDPLAKHDEWIETLVQRYGSRMPRDAAEQALRAELARKCVSVLEDAGVFKLDGQGRAGFQRFLRAAGFERA
ncbi:MAG: UDP-glucose--hexose-1-phosphate uridylyltransferase [Oscillospiraceae bacterium]|nr:UDP-glucose--hexose-1-phosphate uridylyltransferase [Oscillospiraceae bacterium]